MSQALKQRKGFRISDLIEVLAVIGVEPGAFFADAFQWPAAESKAAPASGPEEVPEVVDLRRRLAGYQAGFHGLLQLMVEKELIGANDLAALLERILSASSSSTLAQG